MPKINCAIYVRKSTEKGLEQEFNSLHNQEEACRNYILSQSFNGWEYFKTYEDGGISGGTMERPGLKKMMEDMDSGQIQVVVVYKVDRLSRSIMDFHKMMKEFEKQGCSFVSITQSFDTSNSMGKLTLNMLLSFAQFEREVGSERVRDKIASSKAKGLWMGGVPPLGYTNIDKKLLVEETEAETVRTIFNRYLDLKNMQTVRNEINEKGLFTKSFTTKNKNKLLGGNPWTTGRIHQVLKNVLYLGKTKHKDQIYTGQHEAIVSEGVFEKVQEIMKERGNNTAGKKRSKLDFLLQNKVYFGNERMKHASGKKLHYFKYKDTYIRVDALDETVMQTIEAFIHAKETGLTKLESESLLYVDFKKLPLSEKHELVKLLVKQIVFENKKDLRIILNKTALSDLKRWTGLQRQEENLSLENIYTREDEIVIRTKLKPNEHKSKIEGFVENTKVNLETVEALVKGWQYRKEYENGKTLLDLEKEEHLSRRTIRRHLNLAYLSPKIIGKVLEGGLRCNLLELEKASCSIEWKEQERSIGL